MEEVVRYRLTFEGRVQGVGFRYKAKYTADRYRLTGFVKNEYDGSVTAELQGTDAAIDMFLETIYGDRFIKIMGIDKEIIPIESDERGFIIQY
ncbi:MAG: acylphosphatase [Pseudobutyrivibrio sp.]|nr:acylphosphatase [Pseudobutyrivibrio sp.]